MLILMILSYQRKIACIFIKNLDKFWKWIVCTWASFEVFHVP